MKVPTRTSLGVLPSRQPLQGPSGAGGTPEAFGASVGRSLNNLAGSTMALGAYVGEQEDKKVRFDALRAFSKFQTDQSIAFEEGKRDGVPDGNFYENTGSRYRAQEAAFLASLPPDLQDEFSVRTADVGASLGLKALEHQYQLNDNHFKVGIQEVLNTARIEVGQDPTKENLENQRAALDEAIDATGLSKAEQEAIRRQAYQGLEAVAYRQQQIKRIQDEASGATNDITYATDLLENVSGMDPAAAEIAAGVGSEVAIQAFGEDAWAALPLRIRGVLTSVAAQQGDLPEAVVQAAQAGDFEALATALRQSGNETAGDLIDNPEAALDNDPSFNNVPYEDRVTLTADAERQVAAEIAATKSAETAANKALINSLHMALADGSAGQTDIDQLKEQGIMSYDDWNKANKILDDRDEDLRFRLLGQQMREGQTTFAPTNVEHEKALNAMVGKEGLAAIDQKDSEYAANELIPIVRETGGVPGDVADLVSGMIRSPDPERQYWAMDLMAQIERASPKAYLRFNESDRKDADFFASRKDYLTQDQMVQALRGPLDPQQRQAQVELRKQGRELFTAKDGPLANFDAVSIFQKNWFLNIGNSAPPATKWVGQQLNSDYQLLFLDSFQRDGDVERAKKDAETQITRVWGPTNVGQDNVVMKYPPEKSGVYKPVGNSYDWMENQLRREGILLPDEQFQLVADTQTDVEWQVAKRDENGKVKVVMPSWGLVKIIDGRPEVMIDPVTGKPQRAYFEYGVVEVADENAWREVQKQATDITAGIKMLEMGVKHSVETGVPMPGEILDPQSATGMAAALMSENPDALLSQQTGGN
jgi:hypothetical protein